MKLINIFNKYSNIIALALFILATLQILLSLYTIVPSKALFDFSIYRVAGNEFLNNINPYQKPFGEGIGNVPFNYPPASLFFFSIFSQMDYRISQTIFTILSYICFVLSLLITNFLLTHRLKFHILFLIIAFSLLTFPFKFTLVLGQVNNFVLLFVVSSIFFYSRKNKLIAGVLLAFAACLKFYPILLLFIFIQKKDFKYIIYVTLLFIFLNLLTPHLSLVYFTKVFPHLLNSVPELNVYNQSVYAMMIRFLLDITLSKIVSNLFIIIGLVLIFFINTKKPLVHVYFLLFALLSIVGQFSWQHHLVYAYPFIIIYFKGVRYLIPIFILLAFHFFDRNNALLKNPFISSYQTIGMIIMLSVVFINELIMKKKEKIV